MGCGLRPGSCGPGLGGKQGTGSTATGDASQQGEGGMNGPGSGKGGQASFDEQLQTMTAPELSIGKIDPNGRITVTTFRGLPKPGQVTTEFKSEFERARADAKAPLSSEQIPRRYREGIKRYFDDLEKSR